MQLIQLATSDCVQVHARLEDLFGEARRLGVDATGRAETAEIIAAEWRALSEIEGLAVYLKGGLIQILKMDLAEYDLDGRQLKLWERVQIGVDRAGEYLPPSVDWAAFCTQHLGISRSAAAHHARNFQVYYQQTPDFGVPEMVTAGTGKLKLARTYVETHGLTDDVRVALVGDEATCAHCGRKHVDVPLICYQCGQAFASVQPATYAELEMIVAAKKSKQKPIVVMLKGTVDVGDDINVYVALRMGDDYIDFPVWVIPIGCDSVPSEMVDAVVRLLKRKLS